VIIWGQVSLDLRHYVLSVLVLVCATSSWISLSATELDLFPLNRWLLLNVIIEECIVGSFNLIHTRFLTALIPSANLLKPNVIPPVLVLLQFSLASLTLELL
jgi:hypothetical protein